MNQGRPRAVGHLVKSARNSACHTLSTIAASDTVSVSEPRDTLEGGLCHPERGGSSLKAT